MLEAIEIAVGIWDGLKDHSMEAYKAHTTLGVMLDQLKKNRSARQAPNGFQAASSAYPAMAPMEDANVAPEHSAAMTLGLLSTGGMTPNANMFDQRYPAGMANLLNDPMPQPSTGLTPQYNQPTSGSAGPENAPSPFSNLFGANLFQNLDLPPTDNVNWVCTYGGFVNNSLLIQSGHVGLVHSGPRHRIDEQFLPYGPWQYAYANRAKRNSSHGAVIKSAVCTRKSDKRVWARCLHGRKYRLAHLNALF
jgi:hypothetical protein